jgi:hypothetical protein
MHMHKAIPGQTSMILDLEHHIQCSAVSQLTTEGLQSFGPHYRGVCTHLVATPQCSRWVVTILTTSGELSLACVFVERPWYIQWNPMDAPANYGQEGS